MNTLFSHTAAFLKNTTGRLALTAALAGTGLASSAQAHQRDTVEVIAGVRPVCVEVRPAIELEHRHWVEARFEERQTRVWAEPVYETVPGPRVFVEPVYRTVVDRVWHEPVVREEKTTVLVPAMIEQRDVVRYGRCRRERVVVVPAHYETRCERVIVCAGHFDEVARQELVCAGHYDCGPAQQVLVTAGHFDVRCEKVCVVPAHWEERPVVVVR